MLFQVWKDGKARYINEVGRIILKAKFDWASDFSEGLAAVKIQDRWGYINTEGDWVIEPQFDHCGSFHENRAVVCRGNPWSGGLWGYIDRNGTYVVEPQYTHTENFSCGRALVSCTRTQGCFQNVWGTAFLDHDGHEVVPFYSREARSFSEDLAAVSVPEVPNGLPSPSLEPMDKSNPTWGADDMLHWYQAPWQLINIDGHAVTDTYSAIGDFHEGFAVARKGDLQTARFIYINREGKEVIDLGRDRGFRFSEGRAAVKSATTGSIRYINPKGLPTTPELPFVQAKEFHEGRAAVCTRDRVRGYISRLGSWGFIDSSGRTVIKPQFSEAEPFYHGLSRVYVGGYRLDEGIADGKSGYIDPSGQYVWKPTVWNERSP